MDCWAGRRLWTVGSYRWIVRSRCTFFPGDAKSSSGRGHSPKAYNTPINLGMSTYPFFMTIAVSASVAFLSPVGHSVNMINMGLGGYRFKDYIKIGLPLTLLVMVVLLIILPVFWPYY